MFGFLLGLAAGSTVLYNGPMVRRGMAVLLILGEDAASAVNRNTRRVAAQLSEDLEDIVAEARAEHEAEKRKDA